MKKAAVGIYPETRKADCLRRLKAAEGQIRGLQEMLEAGRTAIDVLTQLVAVQKALRQVSRIALQSYVEGSASRLVRPSDAKIYDELMHAIFKLSP